MYGEGFGDICGDRIYTITSTPVTTPDTTPLTSGVDLRVDTGGSIRLYPSKNTQVGTHTAILTGKLANYPSITLSNSFTITIEPCVIRELPT